MFEFESASFRLPSEHWLDETNERLSRDGMLPARRPMEAYRLWCIESNQSIGLGGEATRVIGEWFAKNTQYGKHVQQPFRQSVCFFDLSFWEISLPLVYGSVRIEPLKQIRGMPSALRERLARDAVGFEEYFQHFTAAYNFFVSIEKLERIKGDGESPLYCEFLAAADRHLLSATSLLLAENMKAIEDCRHVVELSLKAVLNVVRGIDESQLKRKPYNHGLPSTFEAVADCLAPEKMPISVSDLHIFPSIEVRYQATDFMLNDLWQAFKLSQQLATFCMKHVLTRLMKNKDREKPW
ncbi:hypothetical protein [Paraburkholderia youngii]|uniref:Uncharacterized protein n=1 Tax=Paraburkholderia youngii TaxID=2782701 RepID=A0A7Y6K2H4_9BURK|nr:hypothetical protein [Paraburkholderia youngii]NUY02379.1 hypothetical protein [Paraburkholderia youngii]